MNIFTLRIDTNSDAFHELYDASGYYCEQQNQKACKVELARILRLVADEILEGRRRGPVYDRNDVGVGRYDYDW